MIKSIIIAKKSLEIKFIINKFFKYNFIIKYDKFY